MPAVKSVRMGLRQGFTLVEVILVTIVLAIMVTVSTPTLYRFFQQRDAQNDQNNLQELRRALQAYVAERNALPGANTWVADLSGYSNLSTRDIGTDAWGVSRSYIPYTDTTRTLQGSAVPILYATIMSTGPDRLASPTTGVAISSNRFAANGATGWWNFNTATAVNVFGSLRPAGDDQMVKFTDFSEKLARYNLTLERLDRISEALETFAKTNYANQVALCAGSQSGTALCTTAGAVERVVYYPRALAINDTNDTATYFNTTTIVNNQGTDTQRRQNTAVTPNTGMIPLMRTLGLPDEFCCSAITLGADGQPMPFYYFSNPRPRNSSGGCGTRPVAADYKLPARMTSVNNDSGTPPTCG